MSEDNKSSMIDAFKNANINFGESAESTYVKHPKDAPVYIAYKVTMSYQKGSPDDDSEEWIDSKEIVLVKPDNTEEFEIDMAERNDIDVKVDIQEIGAVNCAMGDGKLIGKQIMPF